MILLSFPEFNQYSMPLLILILQGYILAVLLLRRWGKQRRYADLFLALLLIVQAFNSSSYIIGFMAWYDTFRNTKVNYFLISLYIAIGPFIYLYVRSLIRPAMGFRQKDWWHLAPILIYIAYRIFVWIYDVNQPGYWDQQNGLFEHTVDMVYVDPFISALENLSIVTYLVASGAIFWQYRRKLISFFSNTYQVELRWIRNFLAAYAILIFASQLFSVVDSEIIDLHWTQKYWLHIISAIVILYVGTKGYFTNLDALLQQTTKMETLGDLTLDKTDEIQSDEKKSAEAEWVDRLDHFMQDQQPYLNPDLTLHDLAGELDCSTTFLSQLINKGKGKRFKDYINTFRIEAVKESIQRGNHQNMSLLGIAMDAGFNSKATFNRVFRKGTGLTPSEYVKRYESQQIAK